MRTLFIGDVHGCAEELDRLLEACDWRAGRDRVVLVGDLVAKGPDSAGVVRRAREHGFHAVQGNHDAHVVRFRNGLARQGKRPSPEHQQVLDTLSDADFAWLEALPLWLRFPELNVLAVHAGLVPGVPLEAQAPDELRNLRSIAQDGTPSKRVDGGAPWASVWKGPETIVFGHDALRGLQRWPHARGLDSGCVYGKHLTAWVLPEDRLVQVPARRAYVPVDD